MGKIFVQDDFFNLETLQKIHQEVISIEFSPREKQDIQNKLASSRHYLEHPLSSESKLAKEVRRLIKKYFFKEVDTYNKDKPHQIIYFLSNPLNKLLAPNLNNP